MKIYVVVGWFPYDGIGNILAVRSSYEGAEDAILQWKKFAKLAKAWEEDYMDRKVELESRFWEGSVPENYQYYDIEERELDGEIKAMPW